MLPNSDRAIVDINKLQGYCLDPRHSTGRDKARVFATYGIRAVHAGELRAAILSAVRVADAKLGIWDNYGQRYVVDFDLAWETRIVRIRTSWIILIHEDVPRLTSCFVL